MAIEKVRPSFTFTEDRLVELRAVVPEAFADGAINWETLREALSAYVEDEGRDAEHFGLTWPGKREARRLAAKPSKGTLAPSPSEGVDEAVTRNLFIEGDNLEVIKLLQKSYKGQVKLIYIDPPYNTGKDFVYKDNFSDSLDAYLQVSGQADDEGVVLFSNTKSVGRFHSNWLTMMFSRLLVARQLLRDDGVIFVSIDDNELHHLRMMMNEIFGDENLVACIANVNNPKGRSDDKYVATAHESILVYRKSEALVFGGWEPDIRITRRYNKIDKKGRRYREIDLRKTGDSDRRTDRPRLFYYFNYNPSTKDFFPSSEEKEIPGYIRILPLRDDNTHGRWRWELNTAVVNIGRLIPKLMPKRQVWSVFEMDYLEEDERIKPTSAWTQKEVNSERGSEQVIELGFQKEIFPRPKPVGLLRLILELGTSPGDNHIVLDFFAGSGTIAQAIYELNRADQGNRKYICVQLPEPTPTDSEARRAGFTTVSEIGKERIRRLLSQIRKTDSQRLDLQDRDIPEDLGFRVYKLGRSNYKAWQDYQGENVEEIETLFDRIETPLVDGWKPENVLIEILLLQGFPLDSSVQLEARFKHNRVHRVESESVGHRLFVCLDERITNATIEQIDLAAEDVFVCLDSALTDEAKLQLADRCTLRVI